MRIAVLFFSLVSLAASAETLTVSERSEAVHYGTFGAQLDAGVPHGLGASIVVRPWVPLRLQLGAVHNGLAAGGRVGASLVPFQTFVRPVLHAEAGVLPRGDGRLLTGLIGRELADPQLLKAISYRFASARLGLEIGSAERFSVQLQGGLSLLDGELSSLQGEGFTVEGAAVRALIPSLSLGFNLFFG